MNRIALWLDARRRAHDITIHAAQEALLVGDYTYIDPALTDGLLVTIVGQDAHHAYTRTPAMPGTTVLIPHEQVIRLDTAAPARPYDHQRDGL